MVNPNSPTPQGPRRPVAVLGTLLPHLHPERHHVYRDVTALALLAALIAAAFGFASVSVFADDKTPTKITAEEQAKLKAEAADKKAANAKMTKEEKAAARKAANAKKRADESKMEQIGDTGSQLRTAEDAKATAASKMAPAPAKGTLNTPEAEKAMQKQKGQ